MSNEYLDINSFSRQDVFASEKNPSFPEPEFSSREIFGTIRKNGKLRRRRSHLKSLLLQPEFLNKLVASTLQIFLQAIINEQFADALGAKRYQRSGQRTGQRNGYRKSSVQLSQHEDRVELQIPKRRSGTFYPPVLQKIKNLDEQDYEDLITDICISGVSLKRVRRICQLLGADELRSETTTAICEALNKQLAALKDDAVD